MTGPAATSPRSQPEHPCVVCSAGVRVVRVDYSEPGHPRNVHADGSLCGHFPGGVSITRGRDTEETPDV